MKMMIYSTSKMEALTNRFSRHLTILYSLVLLIILLVSCSGSTPPGPNSIGGVAGEASYLLVDWEDGLRIMIWDDIPNGGHGSSSSSSTSDPPFSQTGSAQSADGRRYEYSLESIDGKQADFAIDGVPYNLDQGTVFLILTAGGQKQVRQLDLDLSGMAPTNEGIVDFGRRTSEIATLIAGSAPEPSDAPTATETPPPVVQEPETLEPSEVSEPPATPEPDPEPTSPIPPHPLAGLVYSDSAGVWIINESGESVFVFDQPTARLSPDGRYAVFQPEYDRDIWLADLATGERRNLTESSGRFHTDPQWWPGQQDLIISGSSEQLGPGFGYPTIVRTDGSDYGVLDQEAGGPLAISPDGQMLAYGSFDHTGKIYHWGGATEAFDPADYGLAVEKIFQPAWSPDGRQLAWKVSGDQDTYGWSIGIAVFDLETKTAKLFHTYTPAGGGMVPHYLAWSPSDDWLAFVTFNERPEDGRLPNLWIAQPDGGAEARLGAAVDPVWSPDGQQLAYSLIDSTQRPNVVWIHDTVTGEQRQVLPAGSRVVDWLPPAEGLFQNLQP